MAAEKVGKVFAGCLMVWRIGVGGLDVVLLLSKICG